MTLIHNLEEHLVTQILSAEGQAQYRAGAVSSKELAPYVAEVRKISASYVSHRVGTSLPSPISSRRAAQAYALYYTPINAAKIARLLPFISCGTQKISVLDVGCGPGTATLALLSRLTGEVSVTCVEASREMRAVAESLIRSFPARAPLSSLTMLPDLRHLASNEFNIIVAANVLAEMSEQEAQAALEILIQRLAPQGYLVLLEPGQLAHTRRLMKLRDQILATRSDITPLFPCTHAAPCPMLTSSDEDWCHGEIEWHQPALNAQLDSLLGFNKHRIKFSGFVFQQAGALKDGVRILTPPRKTNAGVEALVCGHELYGTVRIAKRNRSERTKPLEKARVFERLVFSQGFLGEAPQDLVVTAEEG